jgi:hypothetical protein
MKIAAIRSVGLFGETPKSGWSNEIEPEDSVHALIAVHTDADITGFGSVFTDACLVKAALEALEPLYRGENPLAVLLKKSDRHATKDGKESEQGSH